MRPVLSTLIAVSAVLLISSLTGCSVNGWTTRDVPDGAALKRGQTVTVLQKDGSSVTGVFRAIEQIPEPEYETQYALGVQRGPEGTLPMLGETIHLMTVASDSKIWEGKFAGFDQSGLLLKKEAVAEPEHVYLTTIRFLSNGHGSLLHRMDLRSLFLNGEIPLKSALVLQLGKNDVRIALNAIDRLTSGNADGWEGKAVSLNGAQLLGSLMR